MTDVALIGHPSDAEFSPLVRWLPSQFPQSVLRTYEDIRGWELAHATAPSPPLTIVLQSWSDQFVPRDVERLIGATLYSGLFCCFGTWCEGDGRTHGIWPHSTRVPIRYARLVLDSEIRRIDDQRASVPPTAARDEVFLRRQPDVVPHASGLKGQALVVSPDRVYRSTLAQVLEYCGWGTTTISPDAARLRSVRPPHLVVHDFDPHGESSGASVQRCRSWFPHARFCGVASMPGSVSGNCAPEMPVVPRIDPFAAAAQIDQLATTTD